MSTGRIGPHEGIELELMLSGKKLVSFFQDWVPYDDFKPYLDSGQIVMVQRQEQGWPFAYTYFVVKGHEDLAEDLHVCIVNAYIAVEKEYDLESRLAIERKIGEMLGYSEADIEVWLDRIRHNRRGNTAATMMSP